MARRSGKVRQGQRMLTASDWEEAALQLVAEKGLGALTVGELAGRLGVTKGSFYWHFVSRADLLTAALSRWEQRTTVDAVHALNAVRDPRQRLELMLDAASQPPRARSLYCALADAAQEAAVGQVLNRVAAARIAYLEQCYTELGLPAAAAKTHALFAYAAYRGLLQLAHEAPGALPDDWAAYPPLVKAALIPAAPHGRRPRGAPTAATRRRTSGTSRTRAPGI